MPSGLEGGVIDGTTPDGIEVRVCILSNGFCKGLALADIASDYLNHRTHFYVSELANIDRPSTGSESRYNVTERNSCFLYSGVPLLLRGRSKEADL